MNRIFLWIVGLFLLSTVAHAQEINYTFADGEYGRYGVYYNWQFFWVNSGDVEFLSKKETYKGTDCWHIKAVGKTYKSYDFFYRVRDTFEVYARYKDFVPLYFHRALNHGSGSSSHTYRFNPEKQLAYSQIKREKKPLFKDTITIPPGTNDLLSTAYRFRNFDFNNYQSGQQVPYRMLLDNVVTDSYFHYLGKETITTRTGRIFRCHKISIHLMEGDFFHEGEYMKVWFTDDRNRLPVQVETEILVGAVKVILLDTKSLRYPLDAEIK